MNVWDGNEELAIKGKNVLCLGCGQNFEDISFNSGYAKCPHCGCVTPVYS